MRLIPAAEPLCTHVRREQTMHWAIWQMLKSPPKGFEEVVRSALPPARRARARHVRGVGGRRAGRLAAAHAHLPEATSAPSWPSCEGWCQGSGLGARTVRGPPRRSARSRACELA